MRRMFVAVAALCVASRIAVASYVADYKPSSVHAAFGSAGMIGDAGVGAMFRRPILGAIIGLFIGEVVLLVLTSVAPPEFD